MAKKKNDLPDVEYIVEVVTSRGISYQHSFKTQEEADVYALEQEYQEWKVFSWKEVDGKRVDV